MNVHIGWDIAALAGCVALTLVFAGAIGEYLWHAIHHRRH